MWIGDKLIVSSMLLVTLIMEFVGLISLATSICDVDTSADGLKIQYFPIFTYILELIL